MSRVTLRNLTAGLNILVATPGRLLQHMDETPGFDAGGLQVFVLDEADRILDMVGCRHHHVLQTWLLKCDSPRLLQCQLSAQDC